MATKDANHILAPFLRQAFGLTEERGTFSVATHSSLHWHKTKWWREKSRANRKFHRGSGVGSLVAMHLSKTVY
jgi:hypothetical protein